MDVNYIRQAYAGRIAMLQAIFGPPKPVSQDKPVTAAALPDPNKPPVDVHGNPIVLTPSIFDTVFSSKAKRKYV